MIPLLGRRRMFLAVRLVASSAPCVTSHLLILLYPSPTLSLLPLRDPSLLLSLSLSSFSLSLCVPALLLVSLSVLTFSHCVCVLRLSVRAAMALLLSVLVPIWLESTMRSSVRVQSVCGHGRFDFTNTC